MSGAGTRDASAESNKNDSRSVADENAEAGVLSARAPPAATEQPSYRE